MSPRSALATQRRFLHTHRWRVGDLMMWDNRCALHRGTEYDDLRLPREDQAKMCAGLASRQRDG